MKSTIKQEVIDWDKPQLLYNSDIIVLTNGRTNDEEFEATIIVDNNMPSNVGYFSIYWTKAWWKSFNDKIQLSN